MRFPKTLPTLVLVLWLFSAGIAFAGNDAPVLLYVECAQSSLNCFEVSYPEGTGDKILIDGVPQMQVTRDDIDQAKIEPPGSGPYSGILALTLKKDAADRFASLTRQNIGKRLVIVVGDQVVKAPMINAPIEGGWIRIAIAGNPNDLFEKLPWLAEIVESQ